MAVCRRRAQTIGTKTICPGAKLMVNHSAHEATPNVTPTTAVFSQKPLRRLWQTRGFTKGIIIAILAVLAIGGLIGYRAMASNKQSAKPDDKKEKAEKIFEFAESDIVKVAQRNLGQAIPISGSLMPVTQAMVKSKVAGEVARVAVREGERVTQGQVLVTLDTADLRARNDAQRATVAEMKARLELANKNQSNNRALLDKNFISQNAFDGVTNSVQVAQANYQAAVAQSAITERALADATIRAPFAGIIAKRAVNIGEKVAPDAPIAHVVDLARMELEAQVPVSDIPNVKVGQELSFKVDGFDARTFTGKIERINPAAAQGSRSISVFATLTNADAALKGGMFATGTLAAEGRGNVATMPIAALVEEGGQTFVYALNNGTVERKPVSVGARNVERGFAEVRDGIADGTPVITVKADGLKHGAKAVVKSARSQPAQTDAPVTKDAAKDTTAKGTTTKS
jgi:membrane fusion protein, multidrug efflux system